MWPGGWACGCVREANRAANWTGTGHGDILVVMRYALIIAGGSGTRLWPMSTRMMPKQLIPFIDGRSLLQIAVDRLRGLVPDDNIYICAGNDHKQAILTHLRGFTEARFIGEPMGRDTLNAVGLGTAVLAANDPDATVAVFTADHLIEPVDQFQAIVESGYALAEAKPQALVTFGITPTHAATGYGYLELGRPVEGHDAMTVAQFKEKPEQSAAEAYWQAGAEKYLWNSGMFVWQAGTLLGAMEKFVPANHAGLMKVAEAWHTAHRDTVLNDVYPALDKISVDYAVMEPASHDDELSVVAVPMPLRWLDVGSWPAYGQTLRKDKQGNAAGQCKAAMMDSRNVLAVADDPQHVIATLGCDDLIIIHTRHATLVCKADQAEQIKQLHSKVGEMFGDTTL